MTEGGYIAVIIDRWEGGFVRKVALFSGSRIIGSRTYADADATDRALVERTVHAVLNRSTASTRRRVNDPDCYDVSLRMP